jgi:hypothetical protein
MTSTSTSALRWRTWLGADLPDPRYRRARPAALQGQGQGKGKGGCVGRTRLLAYGVAGTPSPPRILAGSAALFENSGAGVISALTKFSADRSLEVELGQRGLLLGGEKRSSQCGVANVAT